MPAFLPRGPEGHPSPDHFSAAETLYNEAGAVIGVATGDMGLTKSGEPGPNFQRGVALLGKYTVIAEGMRGSLAGRIIARYDLQAGKDVPKYGIGLKELWRVDPCGLLAWMLVALLHIDPLTAYLATSPGGVDAAAIIAASTKVDTPFVMVPQTVRVVVLLIIGPHVARWAAGTLKPAAPRSEPAEPLDLGDLD